MAVQKAILFQHQPLSLCLGGQLSSIEVAYQTYGRLNQDKSNVVLICHALTGDAEPYFYEPEQQGWWQSFMGDGLALDTSRYFFISTNVLGGCKGTTGPASINPQTNQPYGSQFPHILVQDMVKVQKALLEHLEIAHLHAVIGGSFGGMQATQWAIDYPDFMDNVVNLCASLSMSAEAIGFNHVMRQAVINDPHFYGGDYYATGNFPERGLAIARMLGMLTYRTDLQLAKAFGRATKNESDFWGDHFQVESYLTYQGQKFLARFDANSYLHLLRALDLYDPSFNYPNLTLALGRIKARYTLVAVETDQLFKLTELRKSKKQLEDSGVNLIYHELYSDYGHDAFLVDYAFFEQKIRQGLGQG